MIKTILCLIFFSFSIIFFGQKTEEPYVSSTNVSNAIIESVTINKNSTDVFLTYWKTRSSLYQAWVSFSSNTYIIDTETSKRYKIFGLSNLQGPLELDQRYSTEKGKKGKVREVGTTYYYFNLEFPALPPGVNNIDIVEELNGEYGFVWRGIKIDNPDNSKTTSWTEYSIKEDWKINGMDDLEGIYENTGSDEFQYKYTIAIKKNDNSFEAIYLSGNEDSKWNVGDIKAIITPTASSYIYKTIWYMADKSINENVYTTFEQGLMKLIWTDGSNESLYIKLFPTAMSANFNSSKNLSSTGTGFAVSDNGYIVTNYHVIKDASDVQVRGINGDFNKLYNASILVEDKNNDLAILKVETSLGNIPYSFDFKAKETGESVFALGYPLLSSMGDEIKLTDGIISSRTGFKGDITSYQTSVPVQQGNSGGPLFDKDGNLVGIINAKHSQADNASYAIKSNYLYNLIQALDTNLNIETNNKGLMKMSLSNQIKKIKDFVYIIEVR